MSNPDLAPLKKPGNWIDLALAVVVAALTYGNVAPESPDPRHVHFPPWAWVALGLVAVALRVLHRWWDPAPAPAVQRAQLTPPGSKAVGGSER